MKEKILSLVFIVVLGSLSIVNLINPDKGFSAKENRYLQQFPQLSFETLISNEFSTEFDKYASDQFISRDNWISLKTLTERMILKQDNTRVYFGSDGYLFDVDKPLDGNQIDININNINTMVENFKSINSNIEINALLVPSKAHVLNDKLPAFAPVLDEDILFNEIKYLLNNDLNLTFLSDMFSQHNKEDIYYKTDHHWTSLGAYYAYGEYLKTNHLDISDFTVEKVSDDFLGTNYRKANFYLNKPDTIEKFTYKNSVKIEVVEDGSQFSNTLYKESYLEKTDKYSYFLGGDSALVEISTNNYNNQNILILKDSFANSMIPFLVNHYQNIYIIDTRYYNGSIKDFVQLNSIKEVLMLYNIQNFVSEKTLSKLKN